MLDEKNDVDRGENLKAWGAITTPLVTDIKSRSDEDERRIFGV